MCCRRSRRRAASGRRALRWQGRQHCGGQEQLVLQELPLSCLLLQVSAGTHSIVAAVCQVHQAAVSGCELCQPCESHLFQTSCDACGAQLPGSLQALHPHLLNPAFLKTNLLAAAEGLVRMPNLNPATLAAAALAADLTQHQMQQLTQLEQLAAHRRADLTNHVSLLCLQAAAAGRALLMGTGLLLCQHYAARLQACLPCCSSACHCRAQLVLGAATVLPQLYIIDAGCCNSLSAGFDRRLDCMLQGGQQQRGHSGDSNAYKPPAGTALSAKVS